MNIFSIKLVKLITKNIVKKSDTSNQIINIWVMLQWPQSFSPFHVVSMLYWRYSNTMSSGTCFVFINNVDYIIHDPHTMSHKIRFFFFFILVRWILLYFLIIFKRYIYSKWLIHIEVPREPSPREVDGKGLEPMTSWMSN